MPINDNYVCTQGTLDFNTTGIMPTVDVDPEPPYDELEVTETVTIEREFDSDGNVTKETRTIMRPRKLELPKPTVHPPRDWTRIPSIGGGGGTQPWVTPPNYYPAYPQSTPNWLYTQADGSGHLHSYNVQQIN